MDKKLLLIAVIAVILILLGGYLVFMSQHGVNVESGDIPLKTQDFKLFSIDTPEGSNFKVKNQADGMKFYQNSGNYSANFSGIIINKGMTDSLIGDNSQPLSNSTEEQVYMSYFKNETVYKYVSSQGDVDVILIGNDLNLLKEASNTIKIKDAGSL